MQAFHTPLEFVTRTLSPGGRQCIEALVGAFAMVLEDLEDNTMHI